MPEPTATPLAQTTELRVTGRPDVKNKHGIGYIKPTDVHLRYAPDGIHAQVYGLWRRTDTLSPEGELTDKRTDQGYDAPAGDMSDWPDWLADLAREHNPTRPAAPSLERGRAQLLEAMSAVSEDRTAAGWCGDWARTLHAEGGIWETLGRAVGWPTGDYDQWVWVSWDEAAALYAENTRSPGV